MKERILCITVCLVMALPFLLKLSIVIKLETEHQMDSAV